MKPIPPRIHEFLSVPQFAVLRQPKLAAFYAQGYQTGITLAAQRAVARQGQAGRLSKNPGCILGQPGQSIGPFQHQRDVFSRRENHDTVCFNVFLLIGPRETVQGQRAGGAVPGAPGVRRVASVEQHDGCAIDRGAIGLIRLWAHKDEAIAGGVQRLDVLLRGVERKDEHAFLPYLHRSGAGKAVSDNKGAWNRDFLTHQASCHDAVDTGFHVGSGEQPRALDNTIGSRDYIAFHLNGRRGQHAPPYAVSASLRMDKPLPCPLQKPGLRRHPHQAPSISISLLLLGKKRRKSKRVAKL